jgi:hypothetical protein
LRRLLVILGIDNRFAGVLENFTGIDLGLRHVAEQVRCDATRVHSEGADAAARPIESSATANSELAVFDCP